MPFGIGDLLSILGESSLRIYGEAELMGTTVSSTKYYAVEVYNGGKLTMTGCDVENLQELHVYSGAEFNADSCLFGCAAVDLAATSASVITGSDLSEATITIRGTSGEDSLIDLSGNYWGTTDMDAIWAKISGDKSRVVIDGILMSALPREFTLTEQTTRRLKISNAIGRLTLYFNREVDATTVSEETLGLYREDGT